MNFDYLIIELCRINMRSSFIFSVVSAAVSLFLPTGSLTSEITRQDRLEYCLSSLVRFDNSASLCHSWTSCSILLR